MEAQGAELVVHGGDFQESLEYAHRIADARGLHMVPSFAEPLVHGTATYALELFRAAADLDAVYVPIGLGSGICGVIAARDALGLGTEIVGVCAERAAALTRSPSRRAGRSRPTPPTPWPTGMACRVPDPDAVAIVNAGAARVVAVGEDEIADAMRAYYTDTHNVAEGAGAAPLAALMRERDAMRGQEGRADPSPAATSTARSISGCSAEVSPRPLPLSPTVMPGLVPGIHVLRHRGASRARGEAAEGRGCPEQVHCCPV